MPISARSTPTSSLQVGPVAVADVGLACPLQQPAQPFELVVLNGGQHGQALALRHKQPREALLGPQEAQVGLTGAQAPPELRQRRRRHARHPLYLGHRRQPLQFRVQFRLRHTHRFALTSPFLSEISGAPARGSDTKHRLEHREDMRMSTCEDRAPGVLVGLAVGDALGAPVEFDPPEQIAKRRDELFGLPGEGGLGWAPGESTDDTQMALVLARHLARAPLDHARLANDFAA